MYLVEFYACRLEVATSVEQPFRPPMKCPPGSFIPADHPQIATRLPFAALDTPGTTPLGVPPSISQEVAYLGPSTLLDDGLVPSCFAFPGSLGGALLVSTSEKYVVTRFTLDNSVVDGVVDPIYYPKEGALWGLFEGALPEGLKNATTSFVSKDATYIVIGNFCFSPDHGPVQTFFTGNAISSFPALDFSIIYLEVLSNWGGSYTCLGRIRLHGNP